MISFSTPLVEVPPGDIRQAAVANALQATNRRAAIPEHHFRELLPEPPRGGPWDLDRMFRIIQLGGGKIRTEGVSTCALVASTLLGRVLALPWDGLPYWEYPGACKGKDVVTCLGILGDQCKAKRSPGDRARPGDTACVGSGYATHVLTVIDDDGTNVWSVDGGQVDDAAHRFLQRTRTCKRLFDAMRFVWILDIERLAAKLPRVTWTVPEGYSAVIVPPAPVVGKSWQLGTVRGQQAALVELGWALTVDGIKGPKTVAAIKGFQSREGLQPDGIVGPITRAVMQAELEAIPI